MNYKNRDDELIRRQKQLNQNKTGYSLKALEKLAGGGYASRAKTTTTKEVPYVKPTVSNNSVSKNEVPKQTVSNNAAPKPSTRYNNKNVTRETKSTRDTSYDKDFDNFYNYREGDFSGEVDYDPNTNTDVEKWRNVKKDIMAKNNWSDKEFEDRYKEYSNDRYKKQAKTDAQLSAKFASEHPVLGTIMQAAENPGVWVEGASNMITSLLPERFKAQSADDPRFYSTMQKTAMKQAVKDDRIKSNIGKTAYDIGTGLGDMVLASGVPVLGAATLGTETASRSQMQALERGVDPTRAALTGAASGAISGVMNKVGLDKALGSAGKTALGTVGKAAVKEGAENVLEDIANLAVDQGINTDKSQLSALHNYYTSQGMDDDTAWSQVAKDTGIDLATSFGSGALFGGVMSGVRNIPALGQELKGLSLNNKGMADIDELASKNPDIQAILRSKPEDIDEATLESYKAKKKDVDAQLRQKNKEIKAQEEVHKNADKKTRDAEYQKLDALRKEAEALQLEKKIYNYAGKGQAVPVKDQLKPDVHKSIYDTRTGLFADINYAQKFAGDTDEAKQLAKDTRELLNKYIESGSLDDYEAAMIKAGELDGLARAVNNEYKSGRYSYNYNDYFLDEDGQAGTLIDRLVGNSSLTNGVQAVHKGRASVPVEPVAETESTKPTSNEGRGDGQLTPEEVVVLQDVADGKYDIPETGNEVPTVKPTEPTTPERIPEVANENVPPRRSFFDDLPPRSDKEGKSKVGTNTMVNSKIFTKDQIDNDPVISELNKYAKANNDTTYNAAKEDVLRDGDTLLNEYINGKRAIGNDLDVDRAMLLLKGLDDKISYGDTSLEAQRNLLFSKLRQTGTLYGQTIQAFKKWNDTPEGAIINGERLLDKPTQTWKKSNKKQAELNGRIAKALEQMGVDSSMRNKPKTEKTHEQIKQGVKNVLEREFGSVENLFNDNDIEYLTSLAENKEIPVWVITDEIEHKMNHGEWYTIDESTPFKLETSSKLASILKNMGNDSLKEKNKLPDLGYGESHASIVQKIRNTLAQDPAAVDLDNPADVEVLANFIEEKIPNWQIEDEIHHRLMTGEWYTLDESIEPKKPINQKLKNALDALVPREEVEKESLTFNEIREQVRNTLDKEMARIDNFSDRDVDYLANLINEGATKDELAQALDTRMATGTFGIELDTQRKVNDLFEYANRYDPDSKNAIEAKTAAYQLIADEVLTDKASPLEKFESWRYLAMLGNPKTMIRNYVGNKMFGAVTGVSNNLSAMLEAGTDKLARKLGADGIQRTKAILNPVDDRNLIKAAANDGDAHRYSELEGTKYEKGTTDAIKKQKSVFNSKLIRLYERATDAGVSDYKAVKKKYSTSLAGYMKANGLDESAFDADEAYRGLRDISKRRVLTDSEQAQMESAKDIHDQLEKARDYAVKQAEYATFHEDNAVAKILTEFSQKARNSDKASSRALGYMLEGMIPFKKTPANILRSGIDYSPLGAIDSIRQTGKLIYENTGNRKGNLENTYTKKSKLTGREKEVEKSLAADVLDSWSKTLTGTGLVALGYYLKNKGILNSSNKDEKWQDDLEGIQNYSITINGKTYTIDWAAPAVMPLLMGAEMSKIKDRNGLLDQRWYDNIDDVADTANSLLDPIFETSMMSGVKDTLEQAAKQVKYDDSGAIGGILGSMAMNTATGFLTQGLPTLSGQIARTIDNTRRTTDTATSSPFLEPFEKQGRKIINKIPGLSFQNEAYYDSYGRTQNNGPFNNPIGNLLYQMGSPAYVRQINTTDADKQARDVYYGKGEDGKPIMDSKVFPSWKSTVKVSGEKFSPSEMATYRKESGEAQYAIRDALSKEDWFNSLDPDKQTEYLKKINTLVDKIGKDSVDKLDSSSKDFEAYESGGVPSLLNYWSGDIGSKKAAEETGLSGSTNAMKEIKAAYAEGDSKKAEELTQKYKKQNEERLKLNEKYGVNIKMADFTRREDANPGSNEEWAKEHATTNKPQTTTTTTQNNATTKEQPQANNTTVDTAEYQKYIDRAGKQNRKFTNDIPKLKELNYSKSEMYTYAYAINQDSSLTPQTFNTQYKKLDLDGNGSMKQDEMITYFNNNNTSEQQAKYLWRTYGENKGTPWKTLPVLRNGKWKKNK